MAYIPDIVQVQTVSASAGFNSNTPVPIPPVVFPGGAQQGNYLMAVTNNNVGGCSDSAGNTYTEIFNTPYFKIFGAVLTTALGVNGTVQIIPAGGTGGGTFNFTCIAYELKYVDPLAGPSGSVPNSNPIIAYQTATGPSNFNNTDTTFSGTTGTAQVFSEAFVRANGLRFDFLSWTLYSAVNGNTVATATSGTGLAGIPLTNRIVVSNSLSPASGSNIRTFGVFYSNPTGSLSYVVGTAMPVEQGTFTPGVGEWTVVSVVIGGILNAPPNPPILSHRTTFDATHAAQFTWTYSDPEGDIQSAYQLQIIRVTDGGVAYDTGKVTSSTNLVSIPTNSLINGGTYQWQVKTWDSSDSAGPYSASDTFICQAQPVVTISAPVNSSVVTNGLITTTWAVSTTGTQKAYQVRLLENGAEVYNTGQVIDIINSYAIPYYLLTGKTYNIKIIAWDNLDQLSAEVTVIFTTNIASAVTPVLSATAYPLNGYMALTNICPTATGGQATTSFIQLFRRTQGENVWLLIADNQPPNSTYYDYGVLDELIQEYKATVISVVNSVHDSVVIDASITLDGIWLHDVTDPAGTIHNFLYDNGERGDTIDSKPVFLQYDGRDLPIVEYDAVALDETVYCYLTLPWDLGGKQSTDRIALEKLQRTKHVLCYRDHRSRKIFGVIDGGLKFDDALRAYTVTFTVRATNYVEANQYSPAHNYLAGTVAPTTVAIPLNSDVACDQVSVQAATTNTATVFVGYSAEQTWALTAGSSIPLKVSRPSKLYVRAASGTQTINWIAQ
jgi:hypothetical protein